MDHPPERRHYRRPYDATTQRRSGGRGGPGRRARALVRAMRTMPLLLLVLLSVACAQVGGAIAGILFTDVGPPGVLLLRLAIAASTFALVVRPRVRSWTGS